MNRLRKNTLIGLLLLFTVVFNGCIDVVEEVIFKKDGSGNYVMNFDMSKMMSMLGGMDIGSMLGGEDGEKMPKSDEEKTPISVDTTMFFKDIIAERNIEVDRAELWSKVKMMINMDQAKSIMKMQIAFDFDDVEEVNYVQANLGKMNGSEGGEAQGGMPGLDGLMGMMNTGTNKMTFKKRKFTLTSSPKPKADKAGAGDELAQQMEMMKMFMADASYKTIYRFPRRVKSVSNKKSRIAEDEKTVVTEVNFLELMEGNVKLDNKIKLKRR